MENQEKNIDDLFRDALDDYIEMPPPAVWRNLEGKLAQVPKPGKFNTRNIWYAALLLLLLLSIPAVRVLVGNNGVAGSNPALKQEDKAAQAATGNNNNSSNNNTGSNNKISENSLPQNTPSDISNEPTTGTEVSKSTSKPAQAKTQAAHENETDIAAGRKAGMPLAGRVAKSKNSNGKKGKGHNAIASGSVRNYLHHKAGSLGSSNRNEQADNEDEQQEAITYNSDVSKPAPVDQANETATNTDVKTEINKPKESKTEDKKPADKKPNSRPKPKFARIEAGIKAGFERGFDNEGGKKAVVSPYIQYNISPRLSVMTQPAFKYASLDTRRIGNSKSYYKENNDSTVVQNGPSVLVIGAPEGNWYLTNFRYSQTHDSIVKTNTIGGSYSELEIPLLLKYKINKRLAVYGGANFLYSKTIAIKENTANYKIAVTVDTYTIKPYINPASPYTFSSLFSYSGAEISQYHGPQYPTTTTEGWRVGYMLGFSYEFYKRWMFDALIQQSNIKPNVQAGININSALSAPYFRLTLGYKLTR